MQLRVEKLMLALWLAAGATSDAILNDPLPALRRPNTNLVVDEMRDSNAPLPDDGQRTFGHHRHITDMFTPDGNWHDLGTAVAADQLAAMTPGQRADFMRVTGAKPAEIQRGDASLMLLAPAKDFDKMVAPRPDITYKPIDYSRLGNMSIQPKWIVVHYTAGVDDTNDAIWDHFNSGHGVPSTQFCVGKQGDIMQYMPETQICDGTLDFNDETVQIEVCGDFRVKPETDAEVKSTVDLIRYLQKTYRIPDTHVISHRQVDNNFGHIGRKPDPTFRFMNKVYAGIKAADGADRSRHQSLTNASPS